jgi:hypothetical protein
MMLGSPHENNMRTLTYNRENNIITKNAIILNTMHNIFNLRDTEMLYQWNKQDISTLIYDVIPRSKSIAQKTKNS